MSYTLAAVALAAEPAAEHTNSLPMAPLAFGITSLVIWAVLLLITFSFKSVGSRHD